MRAYHLSDFSKGSYSLILTITRSSKANSETLFGGATMKSFPKMSTLVQANDKIQQLNRESSSYKILNAMLNFDEAEFEGFLQTKQIVIEQILESENLEELSQLYDDCFLMPMRAKGGKPRSRAQSATERVQTQENGDSDSSSLKSNLFKAKVRERDGNICVLTGSTSPSNGHQVAHFIPQSLLNDRKDSDDKIQSKTSTRTFVLALCPWLPSNFFENLDVCENAILLNFEAHRLFGAFEWFVIMETGIDGKTVYRAMQVEENGLLREMNTGRAAMKAYMEMDGSRVVNIPITVSSYNQPLFIGDSHPQPGFIYVKLHEMLARIFKMRGQAGYYEIDSDDEYEPVDNSNLIDKLSKHQQDSTKTLVINI